MKNTAIICVCSVVGAVISASIETEQINVIPLPRNMYVDPLIAPKDDPTVRIINGDVAVPHSIPYQAHLIFEAWDGSWSCGGSLITPRYVLTAGHCVKDAESVEINLGAQNITRKEKCQIRINSTNVILHENYDSKTITNDIGLVKLPFSVFPSRFVGYGRLPSRWHERESLVGDQARVSGWGITDAAKWTFSDVLREVNSTIISNRACKEVFDIVRDTEICISGAHGKSSCNGDSGGPLVIGNVIQGLVSYGARGCVGNTPVAFTRVAKYLDWIEDHSDWRSD